MNNLIAIDAGLHSAGWAVFNGDNKLPFPMEAGLAKPMREYRDEEVIARAMHQGDQLAAIARSHSCTNAIIEMPVYYGANDRHAGSIFKLCVCIGAIAGSLNRDGVFVETVDVPVWKGQLPKDVVIRRIKVILGASWDQFGLDKDMWDAVGIGLWRRGYFK